MMNRRMMLAGLAAGASAATLRGARAQSWKAAYPELVYAAVPAENASGVMNRYADFIAYLSKAIGTKVTLRIANDYAAVIQGQQAGNIHIGYYGSSSFARARIIGVKTEAFIVDVNNDGSKGYYSVFYVKKESPYQKVADLKGKKLGLVDPNSTSGYNVPLFTLDKMGIDANKYFSNVVITGSHDNAVQALAQGTVDVCANAWTSPVDSYMYRMVTKGLLKDASGKLLTPDDFRIILKSSPILNGPTAYLESLPAELKATIKRAFLDAAKNDKAAFDKLSDGQNRPYEPITTADYDDYIKLDHFVDKLKKSNA